jgi:hypothetical protein
MPSQRLLKMLDPQGHIGGRVLEMKANIAVVYAARDIRDWAGRELTDAGMTPLLATSFRHVVTSLHPSASPQAGTAVIDFDIIGPAEISQLTTLRWNGYRGRVIALSRSGQIDPRASQLASVETVVRPDGPSLRAVMLR